jgi:hypothetical protein
MPPAQRRSRHIRADRRERARARRARRIAAAIILGTAVVVTLLVSAFGSSSPRPIPVSAQNSRLVPVGPPKPEVIAQRGAVNLYLPVARSRITAVAYHASGDGALALDPVGRQANEGIFTRAAHKIFGGGGSGVAYYQLGGGDGPSTAALDVGGLPGTDVYSPVNGTVVGLSPFVLDGRRYGARIELQPSGESGPSVVVALTQLEPDPALTVGSTVTASKSKVGTILDLSGVEKQALARYTQDAGNHVTLEVFPAATLTLH